MEVCLPVHRGALLDNRNGAPTEKGGAPPERGAQVFLARNSLAHACGSGLGGVIGEAEFSASKAQM